MAGDGAPLPAAGGEDDYLDRDEICAALAALTDAELLTLARVEAHYRGGTDFGEGDLVQEVFLRAMAGRRKCRRGEAIVPVLAGAIQSVAGHRRKQMLPSVSFEASPPTVTGEATEGRAPEDLLSTPGEDPETILVGPRSDDAVDALLTLFEDDDEAQCVILDLHAGKKGADLYESTGLTPNQVHYVIRKIRQRAKECLPGRSTR